MSGRTGLLITISLCMIIKNEEAILPRCLNTLKEAVGEIIIMDTGSTGETVKTAGSFHAVYEKAKCNIRCGWTPMIYGCRKTFKN